MSKITKESIKTAYETLKKYKQGKANLEARIVEEEMFWKRRHWEVLRPSDQKTKPSSAWMFNSIVNKHADAMDAYPEAICLPREADDETSANTLTSIIPVVLERNQFEDVYSDNWWQKLKHGFCVYGIFWNNNLNNGMGDVQVTKIDPLNIFWEPGITNIQKSKNIFICDLVSAEDLKALYPKVKINGGNSADIKQYILDENIDTSDKVLMVDWYYKKDGKLHFCKFCEENILFASENESNCENGWYEDGEYPIEVDVTYPEAGTPIGFGIISIAKDPQLYIDELDKNIMDNLHIAAKPRYFVRENAGVKEEEFLDLSKTLVHVSGNADETNLKPIHVNSLPGQIMNFRQAKIDELKETSSNRDFSQGGTMGGVTSGAAIAVLQEAGNKTSRDIVKASYRTYERIVNKVIERMRQFYTEIHTYRIVGKTGQNEYIDFSNKDIVPQPFGTTPGPNGEEVELFRKPIFDIDVKAQKQNPFSTLSQNETAMNLYNAGMFNPEMAQMALPALEMMSFEGKEKILEKVREGMTLQNQLAEMQKQIQALAAENAQLKAGA